MAEQLPIEPRRWLIQLGTACAGRISTDEAADFVNAILPMLTTHFPPAAFTFASLEHVAAQCKYLPTYGEIVEKLGSWWRQRSPKRPAIAQAPIRQRDEPTAEEKAHASWAVSQAIAAMRSTAQPPAERRKITPRHLTQEQLVQAYQRAGVQPPKRSA